MTAGVTSVLISNFALSHCGRSTAPIQSLTENSVEARLCNLWYDQCRRECLEVMDWSFSRRRISLSLDGDAPPAEWTYRYQVPSDMLSHLCLWNPFSGRAVPSGNFPVGFWSAYLGDLTNAIPYALELSLDSTRLTLLTNQANAILVYTADIIDPTLFSSGFVNALSHLLATKIAYAISGKMTVKQDQEKAFAAALANAAANDANQSQPQPPRDGASVRARA